MSMQISGFDLGGRVLPRPFGRPRRGARAMLAAMVALGVAVPIVAGVLTLPVQSVKISGEFVRVSRADIERVVEPLLAQGLFSVDVDALRHAVLDVPGVREAMVHRAWPDGLEIWVVERVAVARWASGGYLEIDGTHFAPAGSDTSAEVLPVLAGPEGSHQRVLDLHLSLDRVLSRIGMALAGTELTRRGVLYASLHDGPRLVMRSEAVEAGLRTYARTLAKVTANRLQHIERVDFRYPTGFAVRPRTNASGREVQE